MTLAFWLQHVPHPQRSQDSQNKEESDGGNSVTAFFFVLVNAPRLHKLLAQFLLPVLLVLPWHISCGCGFTGRRDRDINANGTSVQKFLTFLCALACSSTYFWTSLISSCSFLTSSMWQLASFSVELLNTSHTGAKVLAQTTTHEHVWTEFYSIILTTFVKLKQCLCSPQLGKVTGCLGELGHRPGIGLFNCAPTHTEIHTYHSELDITAQTAQSSLRSRLKKTMYILQISDYNIFLNFVYRNDALNPLNL